MGTSLTSRSNSTFQHLAKCHCNFTTFWSYLFCLWLLWRKTEEKVRTGSYCTCLQVGYSEITRDERHPLERQKHIFCFPWHLRTQIAEEIGKRAEGNVIKSPYKCLQKSKGKDLRFGKVSTLVIFSDITLKKKNLIPVFSAYHWLPTVHIEMFFPL